jgi:predicted nucleotidyltransferase
MGVKDEIFQKLRDLKPELAQKFFVSSIGIFGSAVREDFSEKSSDIDLLVDFSKPVGIEFIDLAEYIEKKLNRKVDLVSKNAIRKSYFSRIQKDLVYV